MKRLVIIQLVPLTPLTEYKEAKQEADVPAFYHFQTDKNCCKKTKKIFVCACTKWICIFLLDEFLHFKGRQKQKPKVHLVRYGQIKLKMAHLK